MSPESGRVAPRTGASEGIAFNAQVCRRKGGGPRATPPAAGNGPSHGAAVDERARLLHADENDALLLVDDDVQQQHPAPRAEEHPYPLPAPGKGHAGEGKLLENAERPGDAATRVVGKAVREDQPVEVLDGCARQLDCRHLQLVERDGVPSRAWRIPRSIRSRAAGMPSSSSVMLRASASASSSACDRSDLASVPGWTCMRSAIRASFVACSGSRVTFSRSIADRLHVLC